LEALHQLLPEPPIITPEPAVLEKLDFSILPESRQELLALLTPHPLF